MASRDPYARSERLEQLLADRATEGIGPHELIELDELLAAQSELDWDDLDIAAAAVDLAFADAEGAPEALPPELRSVVEAQAHQHLRRKGPAGVVRRFPAGWLAAAALLIAFAFLLADRSPVADPASAREELLASGETGLVRAEWRGLDADPRFEGVTGDVVWSSDRQSGYMRFVGMPANDPGAQQYQLWIVDPGRDARPVDGGVFDIPAGGGDVVIPIDAKLRVDAPQAFVITAEQPGGVVVSDGPHLVLAAAS